MFKIPPEIRDRVPAAAIEFAKFMAYDGRWQIGFDELPDGQIWVIGNRGVAGFPMFPVLDESATWRDYDHKFHGEFFHSEAWVKAQWVYRHLSWIHEPPLD